MQEIYQLLKNALYNLEIAQKEKNKKRITTRTNKRNLEIYTLKVELINNKTQLYGHILRTSKYITQEKGLNIKPNGLRTITEGKKNMKGNEKEKL
jgi:hypothetical protein